MYFQKQELVKLWTKCKLLNAQEGRDDFEEFFTAGEIIRSFEQESLHLKTIEATSKFERKKFSLLQDFAEAKIENSADEYPSDIQKILSGGSQDYDSRDKERLQMEYQIMESGFVVVQSPNLPVTKPTGATFDLLAVPQKSAIRLSAEEYQLFYESNRKVLQKYPS